MNLNENVEWRSIPDFSRYEAGSNGELRSYNKGPVRVLKGGVDKDGYRRAVIISNSGARHSLHIARLVAGAFIGPRPDGKVLCHKNGDKTDNRPTNLEYKTQHENILDKEAHGTQLKGELHPKAKLTEPQAREIFNSCETIEALSRKFGVHPATVWGIKHKRNWKHIHND